MKFSRRAIFAWLVALTGVATAVQAASPVLSSVLPRGGQRGTEVQITLTGDRLADAQELFLYKPGVAVKKLEVVGPKQVKALLAISADAPTGEHPLRVRTATGISELRTFWVGALPVVAEVEPNDDFAKAQKIALNTTVEGLIKTEDLDHFSVELRKGQRLTAEVEGIRLGATMFDPYLAVYNADHVEVAESDDSPLLLQDPIASFIAPADGTYVVLIRDSAYGGSDNSHYRVHLGTFPRPRVAYPLGGQVGQDLALKLVGDPEGAISYATRLPAEPTAAFRVFAEQNGEVAPSPNILRVSPFANTDEVEPNNDARSATAAKELPAAFNGLLGDRGDTDWFRFTAKKDQQLDVAVYARRLRSPVDSTLAVGDAEGKQLAADDDNRGTPDSYLRFAVPTDGEYTLWIADHLKGGGPEYVYRIEVTPVQPKLSLSIPLVAANSQERQAVIVPRGNRYATLVRATRSDFGGAVKVDVTSLPRGVTTSDAVVADGLDVVPLVFEAAADAPIAGTLATVSAAPEGPNPKITGQFSQIADLVVFGNQTVYYAATVEKLAVAIAEEAPFKISIVPPRAPMVQSGAMQLKVVAERKDGFTAPINLAMPWAPPGVSAGTVIIAEKTNEALVPLNASGDAGAKKWKVCVLGSADANGPVWVSTQLAEIEIASAVVGGKIELAAGERGKPVQVLCKLEQKRPFEGKAKIELLGLPPNTSAQPKEITATDAEVIFDVTTNEKSPTGQHKSLFCQLTITQLGEPVVQTLAGGGVLRLDDPAPLNAQTAPVAAAPPPAPDAKPPKPLSRLEKLRLEQAQRAKQ